MVAKRKKSSKASQAKKTAVPKKTTKAKKSTKKTTSKKSNSKKVVEIEEDSEELTDDDSSEEDFEDSKPSHSSSVRSKTVQKAKKKNYIERDQDILDFVASRSSKSVTIEEIEEKLDMDHEDIKKALKRLEGKNPPKIYSKLEMEDSRWILRVSEVKDYGVELHPKKKVNKIVWDTLNDLPCFICPHSKKCSIGQDIYNPKQCPYLTDWLLSTINSKEPFTGNPFHPDYSSKKTKREDELDEEDGAIIPDDI